MADEVPSSESSGRQSPTRDYIRFGQFSVEIYPSGPSRLVSMPSSVESVNDVRPNSLPDGGGIEEPGSRISETPGPGAETSHGTDGLESNVEFVLAQNLRQELANNSLERIIVADLDVKNALTSSQFYSDQLSQIAENGLSELRLLAKTSFNLSSEDLSALSGFVWWRSKKRVDFLADFNDMQLKAIKRNRPGKWRNLISELESQGPLLFDGSWINKIVREWINKINLLDYNYKSVISLIRFVRNRWRHMDKFQETSGLRCAKSFYNYLDELFPRISWVSYKVAHKFCKREPWFEEYC